MCLGMFEAGPMYRAECLQGRAHPRPRCGVVFLQTIQTKINGSSIANVLIVRV